MIGWPVIRRIPRVLWSRAAGSPICRHIDVSGNCEGTTSRAFRRDVASIRIENKPAVQRPFVGPPRTICGSIFWPEKSACWTRKTRLRVSAEEIARRARNTQLAAQTAGVRRTYTDVAHCTCHRRNQGRWRPRRERLLLARTNTLAGGIVFRQEFLLFPSLAPCPGSLRAYSSSVPIRSYDLGPLDLMGVSGSAATRSQK